MLKNEFLPGGYNIINGYNNDKYYQINILNKIRIAIKIINNSFASIKAINGQPSININSNNIIIYLPYYLHNKKNNNNKKLLTPNIIINIQNILINIYNMPVQLEIIKLSHPYLDAYILAKFIADEITNKKFNFVIKHVFRTIIPVKSIKNLNIPAVIVGIKVRLAGRLFAEKTRPRITTQKAEIGSLIVTRITYLHIASYTAANIKGAFTVKVWICQRAFLYFFFYAF